MEEGRTELEFDEFEKLLGEIPNATSHSEESAGIKNVSMNGGGGMSPTCVNSSYNNNGRLDEGKNNSVKKLQKPPPPPKRGVQQASEVTNNLPDDQSITCAFAGLSFDDGLKTHLYSSMDDTTTTPPPPPPPLMVVPPFQAANGIPCSFYEFDVRQESSNLSKYTTFEELKKPIENFAAVQGCYQFLPNNVPAAAPAGLQYPLSSDQQQYFMDAQPRIPYLHSQQQHQVSWRNMQGEQQYYRIQQQYLYLQQLHDQRLEAAQHMSGNISSRLTCLNPRHPHFEVPISHRLEKINQERIWNNYMIPRTAHQSSSPAGLSYSDFSGIQVIDKLGKPNVVPEKILTRSHGMNTLKSVKFGAVGSDESLGHVSPNRKVVSSGHLRSTNPNGGGNFELDDVSTWGMFPAVMHLKSSTTDLKAMPQPQQKYNNNDMKAALLPQKYSSMDEVTGRIYLMAKDQHGCRFLQRKFSEGARKDVENIFIEIIDHIVELMTDPFGNYLIQKLLEVCDDEQQMRILHSITKEPGELVDISCDMHGTRAVQKVIETLKTPEQFSMVVSSLKPGIVNLIKNTNGNHVAQRCLQYLIPEHREFLFEAATSNCVELATDRHGCCVLQKCLSHSDGEQRDRLICEITSNALILSQDPFGNYVVQFVFELQLPWATVDILEQLEGNYGDLAVQKYSSNVVEKSLKYAGEERRTLIIQELIENMRLDQIMQDPFGNYVIQAALSQSKGTLHSKLVEAIKPHVPVLRTSPYGKKILSTNVLKK